MNAGVTVAAVFVKAGQGLSNSLDRYPTKYVVVIALTIAVVIIALILLLSLLLCCKPSSKSNLNIVVPTIESVQSII